MLNQSCRPIYIDIGVFFITDLIASQSVSPTLQSNSIKFGKISHTSTLESSRFLSQLAQVNIALSMGYRDFIDKHRFLKHLFSIPYIKPMQSVALAVFHRMKLLFNSIFCVIIRICFINWFARICEKYYGNHLWTRSPVHIGVNCQLCLSLMLLANLTLCFLMFSMGKQ